MVKSKYSIELQKLFDQVLKFTKKTPACGEKNIVEYFLHALIEQAQDDVKDRAKQKPLVK